MPVIRISVGAKTTTTLPPDMYESLLTKLKNELSETTEDGPVIFEIPLGTECFDVLVVWQEWEQVKFGEDRTRLILEAYGDKQNEIAQALGVTYEEAMQQQLLPHVVVSDFENNRLFTELVCEDKGKIDEGKIKDLLANIRDDKRAKGGISLPDGKVALRFPTRKMADNVCSELRAQDTDYSLYWSVVTDVAPSN